MSAPDRVGAFFDLDGTLLPPPSLEWRFISYLLERDEIGTENVVQWLGYFFGRVASDPHGAAFGNKQYLTGIRESLVETWASEIMDGSVPWLDDGMARVRWHIEGGHRVVLVSGTLAPLARGIVRDLLYGFGLRATELDVRGGTFTGRILGRHMGGVEKLRAVYAEANSWNLDLSKSFAYGNEMADLRMLEAVGHPAAVNASWRLRRIASKRGWPVHRWSKPRKADAVPGDNSFAAKGAR